MACYDGIRTLGSTCENCVAGSCVCPDGWTGEADFLTSDFRPWGGAVLECPISEAAVKVLWASPIPFALLCMLCTSLAFADQLRHYRGLRSAGKARWWWEYRPLLFIVLTAVATTLNLTTCVVKLVGGGSIGISPAVTALFATNRVVFYPTSGLFQFEAAKLGTSAMQKTMGHAAAAAIEQRRKLMIISVNMLMTAGGLVPLAQLAATPSHEWSFYVACFFVYFICIAAGLLAHLLLALSTARQLGRFFDALIAAEHRKAAEGEDGGRGRSPEPPSRGNKEEDGDAHPIRPPPERDPAPNLDPQPRRNSRPHTQNTSHPHPAPPF